MFCSNDAEAPEIMIDLRFLSQLKINVKKFQKLLEADLGKFEEKTMVLKGVDIDT